MGNQNPLYKVHKQGYRLVSPVRTCTTASIMEEYPKAVICQLCSQPYSDPRILPCLHSFCLQCLLKEVERRSVKSFKMEQSQQNSGVVKASQPGGSKEGSQDGGSEDVKHDIKCPACEFHVSISKRGVNELPQHLHLGFEAKVSQCQFKIAMAHEVPCDACIGGSSGPSVGFCCQCLQFLSVDVNKQVLQQVEASKVKAAKAIRQAFEKLHSILEEREKQLQSELHDLILCKTTSLGLQNEKFEKMSQDASHYLDFASKFLQNGSDHEVIAIKRLTSTQLEAIFNKANSEQLVPCEHSDITASMETDSVGDELFNFGKIIDIRPSPQESIWEPMSPAIVNTVYKLKVKARDCNGRKYPHGGVKIDVRAELRPIANDQRTSHGKSENHWDGTYTITLTPQTTGPHQLHITMDGQHIKNSPYDLQVRKSKLDYSAGLGNPQLNVSVTSPLCIAIHKKSGDIFVGSEANCIYVYSKDGAQKTTIGSAGNGLCQFNRPCGLDITGDVLYVADCNNHRIQKLDRSGSFICTYGRLGKGKGEFYCPSAIAVDFNDRLIVADQGNSRIQILSSKGSFLVSIDQSKSPGLDLSNICGISLDVQGNIHVVARCNNSGWIIVFTPEGAFVSKHQTVVKPTAIGIDVEGYTLVCDAETNSLHVYDVTRHVCGTIVKNMQSPKGIVLHKDDLYTLSMQQPEPIGSLMSYRHPQQVMPQQPIVRVGHMGGPQIRVQAPQLPPVLGPQEVPLQAGRLLQGHPPGSCSLREALIIASALAKTSVPMLHSGAAILKIAEMEYSGANSIFLRALLDKKYALPYHVVDAVFSHFLRMDAAVGIRVWIRDYPAPCPLPVLWHQSLLTFVQRHKEDMSLEQKEGLMDLVRVKTHHEISHEVRRELLQSRCRDLGEVLFADRHNPSAHSAATLSL
ncbi:hypothetical protein EMCRGX_G018535 [Ephydatia muelleri]